MQFINKKFIVDEHNNKVAVQIDIKDFKKIEEILENYALVQLMKEGADEEILDMNKGKKYYETLDKSD